MADLNDTTSSFLSDFVDGVHRCPRTGIRVVVVGAGIGGMMAALECWRKGHDPFILERAPEHASIGDVVAVMPSGLAPLQYYPRIKAGWAKVSLDAASRINLSTGENLVSMVQEWERPGAGPSALPSFNPGFIVSRVQALGLFAEQIAALGIPILFGRKVTLYEEDALGGQAKVVADTREVFTGDVVIAADGIGTKSHALTTGHATKARSTGQAVSRVNFHPSDIVPGSPASKMLKATGERDRISAYLTKKMHLVTWASDEHCGFTLTHDDILGAAENWTNTISKEQVLKLMTDNAKWDEAVLDLVRQTPNEKGIVEWAQVFRDPQPKWSSPQGRIIQLGDAAHAFLPTSGNGANQALEDGPSLAECLRQGGRSGVPWSVRVHELLRYQRVNIIQRTGFVNRHNWHSVDPDTIKSNPAQLKKMGTLFGRWMWGHSSEKYASVQYHKALLHLKTGAPFENTNLPPGHVFEDWTMDGEVAKEAAGIASTLKDNGDWSINATI